MLPPFLRRRALPFGLALALCASAAAANEAPAPFRPAGNAPAAEATPPALPDHLAPGELNGLIARLTDADVRRLLIERLQEQAAGESSAAAPSEHAGGGFAVLLVRSRVALEHFTETLRARAAQLAEGARMTPEEVAQAWQRVTAGSSVPALLAALFVLLASGLAAHRLVLNRLLGGGPGRADAEPSTSPGLRLLRALQRATAGLLALGAFALTTLGLATVLIRADGPPRAFVLTYVTAALAVLAIALVSRLLIAPDAPSARLAPVGDEAAGFLHRWLVGLAAIGTVAWLTAGLLVLSGMRFEAHLTLVLAIGALMAGLVAAMILRSRPLVASALLGRDGAAEGSSLAATVARSWHVLAILYIAVVWVLWATSILLRGPSSVWAAVGSIALVAALPLIDRLFAGLLARVFGARGADDADADDRPGDYRAAIRRGFRVALAIAAAILVPHLWGVDVLRALGAPGAYALWNAVFNLTVTALLAYVVWQLAEAALARAFGPAATTVAVAGTPAQRSTRARTLRPLVRTSILSTLIVLSTMIALSAIGVNIGPLLAGAGVVGLAIGFGAQTLVRDVVSGIFFLLDDAFRVGEYVEAGNLRGTVEAISVRSFRLRHQRGAVHTVPYGELRSLTNHSRDWVIMKLDLLVTYGSDVDRIKVLLKQIGKDMLKDPELGPNLIEPLKSQGIYQLSDSGILVRAKFTAKPGEQFIIRREAYRRITQAFAENGIQFAYPTVTISATAGGGPATPPPAADNGAAPPPQADGVALPDAATLAAAARAAARAAIVQAATAAHP